MLAGVEWLKGRSCRITVQCTAGCRQEKAPAGMPSPWHTQETYIAITLSQPVFFFFQIHSNNASKGKRHLQSQDNSQSSFLLTQQNCYSAYCMYIRRLENK